MNSYFLTCAIFASLLVQLAPSASAADLKIVDATGLVRSAKVVQDEGDLEVALVGEVASGIVCTLKNVDGLAQDKSVSATSAHTCVFAGIPAGTWQLSTSKPSKWHVRITGDR